MQDRTGEIGIRQAAAGDAGAVEEILNDAARWLERQGMPLWQENELAADRIAAEVSAGLFYVAEYSGQPAGTLKFQLQDPVMWPEMLEQDAAYLHRLAVHRRFAGAGVGAALLQWAIERTRSLGRGFVRLDCLASRPRLRGMYESFGFRHHSDRQAGTYFVSRYEYDVRERRASCPRISQERRNQR